MLFQCWRCNNMLARARRMFLNLLSSVPRPVHLVSDENGECEGASGVCCFGTSFHFVIILINMLTSLTG